MQIVLLHECYRARVKAHMASIYDNVHLDLSYGIPFLGFELFAFTRAAVAAATTSKLLYSSDGLGVPSCTGPMPFWDAESSGSSWTSADDVAR